MAKTILQIVLTLLLCQGIISQWKWDFAVTTDEKIIFYDENWSEVTSAAHEFEDLSAIFFDDIEERIYFSDQKHNNFSIFSLKLALSKSNSPSIEKVIPRTPNEYVGGITYDPLNRNIFWTDIRNKKILFFPIDSNETVKPKVLFDFTDELTKPDGIAVDICRRKLYWTNSYHKKATIESASLSGENRTTLIDTHLYFPHGIVIDQLTDRIYYVVDQAGVHYTVESTKLDGTDRRIIVKDINSEPFSLTVTSDYIYWTDSMHKSIWKVPNDNATGHQPIKVKSFSGDVRGIVSRSLSKLNGDADCKSVLQKVKKQIIPKTNRTEILKKKEEMHDMICFGMGVYNEATQACSCNSGYSGARCQTYECHNFCVHGTCEIIEDTPRCTCKQGFMGDRCQTYKCNDYCLNGGLCSIVNNNPVCDCGKNIIGDRCENNATDTCTPFCTLIQRKINVDVPAHCFKPCKNFDPDAELPESEDICSTAWNKSIIVIVVGVLGGLALIYLIIQAIRRIYKPARPRIKKTFVVQKKISQTPLTSRPISTEQCEITIENCCNMNICDTPCFDPKLLQQNMSNGSRKEDKQNLIQNIENDIY